MKTYFQKKFLLLYFLIGLVALYVFLSRGSYVENPEYGISFNTLYAEELGLNWKTVYDAMFDELNLKKVRIAAHWTMVEPERDKFNFVELDYQVKKAQNSDAEIIFALGKRLPRWPECHVPDWALDLTQEEQEERILNYIKKIVARYEEYDAIKIWQVENEAFLSVFAKDHCFNFNENFLKTEIDLVKDLDMQDRPILITDSGELSTWRKAYQFGDMFGTTMYVYSWNSLFGEFRNPFLPSFYTVRENVLGLFFGKKEVIIAELALEPWLDKPIIKERTDIQIQRMSPEKFDTVIEFAKKTGMKTHYLWGAEWWYYMDLQGNSWYWDRAKELFGER